MRNFDSEPVLNGVSEIIEMSDNKCDYCILDPNDCGPYKNCCRKWIRVFLMSDYLKPIKWQDWELQVMKNIPACYKLIGRYGKYIRLKMDYTADNDLFTGIRFVSPMEDYQWRNIDDELKVNGMSRIKIENGKVQKDI